MLQPRRSAVKREIQNAENRPYDAGDSQARRKFQMLLSKAQRNQVLTDVEQEINFRRIKRNAEQAA